jgi:cbb3-type cytochrome oxidase subunit 3
MPDSIVIMRAALLLGLIAACVALVVWLMRPKARREMDDAALIPWRDEERPPPPGSPGRENGR